jgi:hypothetical protein
MQPVLLNLTLSGRSDKKKTAMISNSDGFHNFRSAGVIRG